MSKRIWLLAAALAACTNAHGPREGTQTGNPPFLDRGKVKLEVSANEVHITGEPGAAAPGGATIEITNLTTGKIIVGKAAPDGSFDVRVDGSLDDAFVVRAVANGQESPPLYVVRGGAVIPGKDDGSLTCNQHYELARAVIDASAATADRSCRSADDCTMAALNATCVPDCAVAYVTKAGAQQIEASIEGLETGLCASWAEDRCTGVFLNCMEPAPPDCLAGQCVARGAVSCEEHVQKAHAILSEAIAAADTRCEEDSDCVVVPRGNLCQLQCGAISIAASAKSQLDAVVISSGACEVPFGCPQGEIGCDPIEYVPRCEAGQCTQKPAVSTVPCTAELTCFTETLTWGTWGAFTPYHDQSELAPCAHYTHRRITQGGPSGGEPSCERDLVACNSIASTGAVMNALGNADVQRALADRMGFGGVPLDVPAFRVTYGDLAIAVGTPDCKLPPPHCIPPPPGVAALVQLLQDLDDAMLMTEECADFPR